jgi:hypothetical protein
MVFRVSFSCPCDPIPINWTIKKNLLWTNLDEDQLTQNAVLIYWNLFRINQNLQTHIFFHLAFLPSISHFLTYYEPFGLLTPCSPPSFLTTKSLNAISKMPHYYQDYHHQALLNCNFPMGSLAYLGGHFHFIPNGMQKI